MIVPFLLGFLGSMHCIGMCGPIALALPVQDESNFKKWSSILLYHFSRIFTYSILGFVLGYFSLQVLFFGYQQFLSILLGSLLLLSVLPFYGKNKFSNNFLIVFVKTQMQTLFQKKGIAVYILLGLLNGLLPCGFVYLALVGAATSLHWWYGMWFMFCFGLGTLPAMLSIAFFKNKISLSLRNQIKRWSPYIVVIMGFLLILRGLNLGIPYISPYMSGQASMVPPWCH